MLSRHNYGMPNYLIRHCTTVHPLLAQEHESSKTVHQYQNVSECRRSKYHNQYVQKVDEQIFDQNY